MRTKYFIISLVFGSIFFTSCKNDFLELYPEGNLNEENFYKTASDFQQAIVGAYVPMREIANVAYFMDEIRSDNTHYDYNSKDRGNINTENLVDFLDQPNNGVTLSRYQAAFNGVSRTNVILDRLEAAGDAIPDSVRTPISAEAKALRGHYYFDLVKNFGGVPLHLHEVTLPSEAYLPRSTKEEVYSQIVADLTEALGVLPAPNFTAAQTGRITKGTVATELGAVYLQQKDYANAITQLTSVTTMGYELLSDFSSIFNPATKNGNKELILDVQYQSGTTGQQSNFIYRFTPITTNTMNVLGVSFNNTIGGWNVPTQNMIDQFESGDKRLNASIGVVEGTLDGSLNFQPTGVVDFVGYVPKEGVEAKLFPKKYFYPPYPNLNQNTDQNWPVYRYADVLLMLAEALNESDQPAQALTYLNQVRSRAGLSAVTTTDKTALAAAIAKERRTELLFENKRWQDLIRTGQAVTVMNAYGEQLKSMYSYLLPQSYTVTENRLLYPIPLREMQLNAELVQNPGY